MNDLASLLSNKVFWMVIGGYWIYSAFAGALPTPAPTGSQFYKFFFSFCHILAGNMNRAAVAFRVPGATPGDSNAVQP